MIHASNELVSAMRGECPALRTNDCSASDLMGACHARSRAGSCAFACEGAAPGFVHLASNESTAIVDCPNCLLLMREARGVREDELQLRVAAIEQSKREASMNAEREAEAAK